MIPKKTLHKLQIALTLSTLATGLVWADGCATSNNGPISQSIPFVVSSGTGSGCLTSFSGYSKIYNPTNVTSQWITVPTNATTVTLVLTNASFWTNDPSGVLAAINKIGTLRPCTNSMNALTFSTPTNLTSSYFTFCFGYYSVASPSPLVTNTPVGLQVSWQ